MRNSNMTAPFFAILIFALVFGFVSGSDPCKNYKAIDDPYRSIAYKLKPGDVAICDYNLPKGWYRFTSDVGGMMPETSPASYYCGTVAPVWIKGTHPTVINETKSVTACTKIFRESCKVKKTIRIKKCKGYFVYLLRKTFGCSMAYCAGNLS